VVEFEGGYFQVDYYSQDLMPILSDEGPAPWGSPGGGAAWITLANPNNTSGKATAPQSPTGVTASYVSANTVSLTWNASEVLGIGDVSSYNIYESTTNPGANPTTSEMTLVGTSASPAFTVTGLSADTNYYFAVSASDVAGTSPL